MSNTEKFDSVMKNFLTDEWKKLDTKEKRFEAIKAVEAEMAKREGRNPKEIRTTNDPDVFGLYDPKEDVIYIHEDFLVDHKDPEKAKKYNSYEALNTIIHEGRHAYQHDCVHGHIQHNIPKELIEAWRMNYLTGEYPAVGPNKEVYYFFSPREDDTRVFTFDEMKKLHYLFKDDANYLDYLKKEEDNRNANTRRAKKEFGENFKSIITIYYELYYDKKIVKKEMDSSNQATFSKSAPDSKKRKFSLVHMGTFAGVILALILRYIIFPPRGLIGTIAWVIASIFPFLPMLVLAIWKKGLPKFLQSKLGGYIFAAIYIILFLLAQIIAEILTVIYIFGGIFLIIKFITEVGPGTLTITKKEADGTTSTEIRLITDESDVKRAENELRDQGYTIEK